jgi:ABC-type uncharacterized transport system permease subunit
MTSTDAHDIHIAPRALEVLALVVAVVVKVGLGLAVPGLGLVLGLAFGLIAYRHRPGLRTAFIVLGVAVTLLAAGLAWLASATPRIHAPARHVEIIRQTS